MRLDNLKQIDDIYGLGLTAPDFELLEQVEAQYKEACELINQLQKAWGVNIDFAQLHSKLDKRLSRISYGKMTYARAYNNRYQFTILGDYSRPAEVEIAPRSPEKDPGVLKIEFKPAPVKEVVVKYIEQAFILPVAANLNLSYKEEEKFKDTANLALLAQEFLDKLIARVEEDPSLPRLSSLEACYAFVLTGELQAELADQGISPTIITASIDEVLEKFPDWKKTSASPEFAEEWKQLKSFPHRFYNPKLSTAGYIHYVLEKNNERVALVYLSKEKTFIYSIKESVDRQLYNTTDVETITVFIEHVCPTDRISLLGTSNFIRRAYRSEDDFYYRQLVHDYLSMKVRVRNLLKTSQRGVLTRISLQLLSKREALTTDLRYLEDLPLEGIPADSGDGFSVFDLQTCLNRGVQRERDSRKSKLLGEKTDKLSEVLLTKLETATEEKPLILNEVQYSPAGISYAGQLIKPQDPVKFITQLFKANKKALPSLNFDIAFGKLVDEITEAAEKGEELEVEIAGVKSKITYKDQYSYINDRRINKSEIASCIRQSLCFSDQHLYEHFLSEVTKCSLRIHQFLKDGVTIQVRDDIAKLFLSNIMLPIIRDGSFNYIELKERNIRIKNINKLLQLSERTIPMSQVIELFTGDKILNSPLTGLEIKELIEKGKKKYEDAITKSKKLLDQTIKLFKLEEHAFKGHKGFKLQAKSGKTYFIECDPEKGHKQSHGVYDLKSGQYVCIVDKSTDQAGFDPLINRIYALHNDSYLAKQISTLRV